MSKYVLTQGMNVIVNDDIEKTREKFSASDEMYAMCGGKYTIENVHSKSGSVELKGWSFHVDDVTPTGMKATASPQPFKFDEASL